MREWQQAIDRREFLEWYYLYQHDPWDEARADMRSAQIAQILANAHRPKGHAPLAIKDFMPQYGKQPIQHGNAETTGLAVFHSIAHALGIKPEQMRRAEA